MLCGVCWREVERAIIGEYSGILVCEDCYWDEIETEDALAGLDGAAEEGWP